MLIKHGLIKNCRKQPESNLVLFIGQFSRTLSQIFYFSHKPIEAPAKIPI